LVEFGLLRRRGLDEEQHIIHAHARVDRAAVELGLSGAVKVPWDRPDLAGIHRTHYAVPHGCGGGAREAGEKDESDEGFT
jgi:hypothetical protein